MITFYTSFRPFEGHMKDIQIRALESWLMLKPTPQILVIGGDKGSDEICSQYGLTHLMITKSETGAPYIDEFIKTAEKNSLNDVMLLVSGDIVLSQDTMVAAEYVSRKREEFCVCARKFNVDYQENGNFRPVRWAQWRAGDYFMHSKGMFDDIPKFLMGRCALDNWMFRYAIKKDALIDGTKVITVWHQMHSRKRHENKRFAEIKYNRKLYKENNFSVNRWGKELERADIYDANYIMTDEFLIVENETSER